MSSRTPDVAAQPGATPGGGTASINLVWAERFVAALASAGVRDAVVCPGSRSAPLALALHRSTVCTHVAIDERAGAYFALGLAKGSRRPAAVLTTSGTAAANLFPAVVEAFHARVPLIVLTADRPPELRDTGAPQTIDQIKLFGDFVRWFCEVGTPGAGADLLDYVGALGSRAAAEAWGTPSGPVHLNFAFREPLVPEPDALGRPASAAGVGGEIAAEPELSPPPPGALARAARALHTRRRGLIVCGPGDDAPEFAEAIARLAAVTGYPVLADPASQVRYGPHDRTRVLGTYDTFLRAPRFAEAEAPELVLQFGAPLTSKAFHLYAAHHLKALHLLVDPAGNPRSPARRAHVTLGGDPAAVATGLADALQENADPLPRWFERWSAADRAVRAVLERAIASGEAPAEGTVFAEIVPALPDSAVLYVGNSMAIRDLDAFAPESPRRLRVLAHRGVNGIDGVVSAALGASAAIEAPLLLVTGDLSFHHDLTGLYAAREGRARATLLVLNNDGGGIFSFLPIARHGDAFERYFATPHGLDFEPAVTGYGIPFERATDAADARTRVLRSLEARAVRVIEVRSERTRNHDAHRAVWSEAVRIVESLA